METLIKLQRVLPDRCCRRRRRPRAPPADRPSAADDHPVVDPPAAAASLVTLDVQEARRNDAVSFLAMTAILAQTGNPASPTAQDIAGVLEGELHAIDKTGHPKAHLLAGLDPVVLQGFLSRGLDAYYRRKNLIQRRS